MLGYFFLGDYIGGRFKPFDFKASFYKGEFLDSWSDESSSYLRPAARIIDNRLLQLLFLFGSIFGLLSFESWLWVFFRSWSTIIFILGILIGWRSFTASILSFLGVTFSDLWLSWLMLTFFGTENCQFLSSSRFLKDS